MRELIAIIIGIIINAAIWVFVTKRYLPDLMQDVVLGIGEGLSENIEKILINPTVKKGFSLAGKLSGESRNLKAAENNFANQIVEKTIGDYKPIIKGILGIDVDQAIEDYGAPAVLQMIQKFEPAIRNMLGGKTKIKQGGIP